VVKYNDEEATEFLGNVRRNMRLGDRLLLGADLVKDSAVIECAYNDRKGVTVEFNKNILRRINRELDADFDLSKFRHHAPYLSNEQRVEMRLVSMEDQEVEVEAIGQRFQFEAGEFILTETCHKYTLVALEGLCSASGLKTVERWFDPNHWFTLVLLAPEDP
jgi:L-histidine N-alpha-methyltransferase